MDIGRSRSYGLIASFREGDEGYFRVVIRFSRNHGCIACVDLGSGRRGGDLDIHFAGFPVSGRLLIIVLSVMVT